MVVARPLTPGSIKGNRFASFLPVWTGIEHVAFVNPGGDCVLVPSNEAEERNVSCRFNDRPCRSRSRTIPWLLCS